MNNKILRAQMLIQQDRYDHAERELRGALIDDPDDSTAHWLLALCLLDRKEYDEATRESEQAIHLAPDESITHRVYGQIMLERDRYDQAENALRESIRLDPYDSFAFGLLASLKFSERRWEDAANCAEQGLSIDPEDELCSNMRTLSLEKLGRLDDAVESAAQTLKQAPDSATAHAAQGFAYLNAHRHAEAKESFREALRLDPDNELARQGMITALHSRSILFRLIFRFNSFMSRLSQGAQWMVIIGAMFGRRIIGAIGNAVPALKPLTIPLIVLYVGFVLLTWLATPLFNTFLRFNSYGRYLLTRDQIMASNMFAGCLGFGVFMLLLAGPLISWYYGLLWFGLAFVMLLPIAGMYGCDQGWPRNIMAVIVVVLAALGVYALVSPFLTGGMNSGVITAFVFGHIGAQVLSNVLAFQKPKK